MIFYVRFNHKDVLSHSAVALCI